MRTIMAYVTCEVTKIFIFEDQDLSHLDEVFLGAMEDAEGSKLQEELTNLLFEEKAVVVGNGDTVIGIDYRNTSAETPIKLRDGDILIVCGEIL